MILVGSHTCYSPYPPLRYSFNGNGHGQLFHNQVPIWNLAWLSCPDLDGYLQPYQAGAIGRITNGLQWLPLVLATARNCHRDHFPELHYLLTLEPDDFLYGFEDGPWQQTTAGRVIGERWIPVLRQRVQSALANPLSKQPLVLAKDGRFILSVPVPIYEGVKS